MNKTDDVKTSSGNRVLTVVTFSHFLNHLNNTGMSFVISVFVSVSLGLSAAEVGLVVAVGNVVAGLFQLGSSFLIRRYSARLLLTIGNGLMAISGVYFGVSSSIFNLVGARLVWGLGSAPQHPVGTSAISDNFEHSRRGRMLGLSNGITYLGNVLGPLAALELVLLWGWRISAMLFGGFMAIAIAALLFGLKPQKIEEHAIKFFGSLKSFTVALRDRDILLVALSSATIGTGGLGVLTTFLPLYMKQSLGMSSQITAILTTVFLLGGPVGSNLLGRLSDKWSRKNASITAILTTGLLVVVLTQIGDNFYSIGLELFVLGTFALSLSTVQQSYLSEISNPSLRDMAYGIYFTLNFGVGSLWTSFTGLFITSVGYHSAFWILSASTIPASLLLLISHEFKE